MEKWIPNMKKYLEYFNLFYDEFVKSQISGLLKLYRIIDEFTFKGCATKNTFCNFHRLFSRLIYI